MNQPLCLQLGAAPAAATSTAGSASQKEFEKLFEAYAAKNPANGEPNPNCRMKVYHDAIFLRVAWRLPPPWYKGAP